MAQSRSSHLLIIFTTVFIDMVGVGIIIPVIPVLFFDDYSLLFAPGVSDDRRSILYGLLIASYPVMQFFGAPVLGSLSDRYGRRPMLGLSLIGTMIGYLLFAYAVLKGYLWLLFLSRMLPGFMGGNIAIVLSAISDVSGKEARARNFGLVGVAFGLGFILGPTLGGILADNTIVGWFNPATPFWFTAGLTGLNILLVQFRFRETLVKKSETKVNIWKGFRNVAKSFRYPQLRDIFSVVLLLSLGFTFFTQFFSVMLIEKFDYGEKDIGLLYGWTGIWLTFTQGVTVRFLSRKIASARVLLYSILGLGTVLSLILFPTSAWWMYLLCPFIATFQGITTPNLTAVVSAQASDEQQGEILGINQSMSSLGHAFPPIIAGYLHTLNSNLPLTAAAIITLLGWLAYLRFYRRNR